MTEPVQRDQPLPVHLVAGPLGVGKTTAILSYVKRNADREQVAVLVNDFGPIGMDGAIMQGAIGRVVGEQMKVLTIPGGCLCCASADALTTGLPRLASLPGITRIIIEPSGIAMPAQVVDLARGLASSHVLDIRPSIVMLDAAEFAAETAQQMPYYRRLVEAADVLVGNRIDRAPQASIDRFRDWAKRLDPPKLKVLTTSMGELPDEVFELRASMAANRTLRVPDHDHHHAAQFKSGGATWAYEAQFSLAALRSMLRDVCVMRFKGIFNTDAGWKLLEMARGEIQEQFTDHRRDSRADWITEGTEGDAVQDVPAMIEACIMHR